MSCRHLAGQIGINRGLSGDAKRLQSVRIYMLGCNGVRGDGNQSPAHPLLLVDGCGLSWQCLTEHDAHIAGKRISRALGCEYRLELAEQRVTRISLSECDPATDAAGVLCGCHELLDLHKGRVGYTIAATVSARLDVDLVRCGEAIKPVPHCEDAFLRAWRVDLVGSGPGSIESACDIVWESPDHRNVNGSSNVFEVCIGIELGMEISMVPSLVEREYVAVDLRLPHLANLCNVSSRPAHHLIPVSRPC